MTEHQIVIDTNVFVAGLRSQLGASYRLLMLINSGKFKANVSVPLIMEYEDVAKRSIAQLPFTENEIDALIDNICKESERRKIFYLWRPFLKDPKDDMVLELAVSGNCDFIVTYNKRDFIGIEQFGIKAITAKEFLQVIGDIP